MYMAIVKQTCTEEYWSKMGVWPKYCIMRFCGYNRFHLLPPSTRLPATKFYEKLEPVALILRINFQSIITPATSVSIDEIMVRFTGRSKHTVMMRGKPCPVGYNILALCEAGYLYSFIFSSPQLGSFGLPANLADESTALRKMPDFFITTMIKDLSKTSRAVLYLML